MNLCVFCNNKLTNINFNILITGWNVKDQIVSMSKKWLSQSSTDTDDFGFPTVSNKFTIQIMFYLSFDPFIIIEWRKEFKDVECFYL